MSAVHARTFSYDYATENAPGTRRVIPHTLSMEDDQLPGQVPANAQQPVAVIVVQTNQPMQIVLPPPRRRLLDWDWCVIV